MFATSGILFNHESPRRGETFVTRKISRAVAAIAAGRQKHLYLGNLEARRDWGFAGDYVEAMWAMLQKDVADDYVIATGKTKSVRQLVETAFNHLDIVLEWQGTGISEVGIVASRPKALKHLKKGDVIIKIDPNYYRPTEVDLLIGDASKAREELGWKPKYTFEALIQEMVDKDIQNLS